ncbi:MAG: hypothetical protein NVS3B12_25790 [Acidimicrobiales bacterium]
MLTGLSAHRVEAIVRVRANGSPPLAPCIALAGRAAGGQAGAPQEDRRTRRRPEATGTEAACG